MSPGKTSVRINEQKLEDIGMDGFYDVMGDFYTSKMKRHDSPTRRLMQMKDSCWKHKEKFSKDRVRTQDYSLTYCTSPDKAYVIEPHGGEINYDLAYKKPNKFYDNVMKQDVTQHKVRMSDAKGQGQAGGQSPRRRAHLEISSKVGKRKIG